MHKRIPRLIVMVGLSASGKSSYAKELENENPTNTIVISSDAIREEICGSVEDQSKNGEVFRIFHERIRRNLEDKKDVIADQPFEGQVIATYKSNLIIPQIRWGEYLSAEELKDKTLINPPSKCPLCGGETEIIKENNSEILTCKNLDCQGKLLGKLSHAVSKNALDIDGLSDATLQRFINKGWICCIKDIYHLCAHKTDMLRMDGFGEKSVENLLGSIGRSRIISLDRFLAALSIPLIGTSASKDIAKMCNYDIEKFKQIMGESPYKFTAIDGFGDKMAHSLFVWWTNNCGRFLELEKEFFFEEVKENPAENKLEGKNFVITGKLHHFANRSKLKEKIEQLGGKVVGSISSKTDYLINNDKNSTSSKNIKAKQLNIPIISENDFEQMVEVKE